MRLAKSGRFVEPTPQNEDEREGPKAESLAGRNRSAGEAYAEDLSEGREDVLARSWYVFVISGE